MALILTSSEGLLLAYSVEKLAVKPLAQPSTQNVLDLPGDWYLTENQRLGNLEFSTE